MSTKQETDNPTVFVPNRSTHDYTDAWDYGNLVFCTEGMLNRLDLQTMYHDLLPTVGESEPDDIILLSSLTSLCAVACAMFASRWGHLNVLVYEDGEYHYRHIEFPEGGKK